MIETFNTILLQKLRFDIKYELKTKIDIYGNPIWRNVSPFFWEFLRQHLENLNDI